MRLHLGSSWRWILGAGLFAAGSFLAYAIHTQNWRVAQAASILGITFIIAGVALLAAAISAHLRLSNRSDPVATWLTRLALGAAIGMGLIVLYAVQYQQWVVERVASCAGIGLMTAGAAWLTGALLGFIFGLPHRREGASASTASPRQPSAQAPSGAAEAGDGRYRPGTSLEEISDWLTKMIVGVGLTQLNRIPGRLSDLATYIAQGLLANAVGGGYADLHAMEVNRTFALAICIYFSVDGFLFGFLWARLYLLRAYRDADLDREIKEAKEEFADMSYVLVKARDVNRALDEIRKKKKKPPLVEEKESSGIEKKESPVIKRYEAEELIEKLRKYSSTFPTSRSVHIILSNLYDEIGKREEAVRILRQFIAYRQEIGQSQDDDVASAWFNLACIYSTEAEKATDGKAEETEEVKNKKAALLREAAGCLRKCLETASASGTITLTIQLDHARTDEDLKPLRESEFANSVFPGFPTTQATFS